MIASLSSNAVIEILQSAFGVVAALWVAVLIAMRAPAYRCKNLFAQVQKAASTRRPTPVIPDTGAGRSATNLLHHRHGRVTVPGGQTNEAGRERSLTGLMPSAPLPGGQPCVAVSGHVSHSSISSFACSCRAWASSLSGFGLSSSATNRVSVVLRFGFRAGRKHKNT